ncbi:hypothetical protein ACFQ0B_29255 [Nonomuraea thailandensis]
MRERRNEGGPGRRVAPLPDSQPLTQPPPASRKRRSTPSRNPLTPLGWVSVVLTLVLVAAALGAYGYYRFLDNRIPRVPIDTGASRPPDTGALNVLLVGSDSREGNNKKYGATTVGAGSAPTRSWSCTSPPTGTPPP